MNLEASRYVAGKRDEERVEKKIARRIIFLRHAPKRGILPLTTIEKR